MVKDIKKYICEYCEKESTTSGNLLKHVKICKFKKTIETNAVAENKLLKQQLEEERRDNEKKLEEKDKEIVTILKQQVEDLKKDKEAKDQEVAELKKQKELKSNDSGILAHGGLGYCKKNYTTADPIGTLIFDEIYPQEDKFEELLLYKFKENTLAIYFGKGIIKEYKKEDPQDQSLWCSDTTRLSYIIREAGARKNKWSSDKNGLKFINCVIKPILAETKDIIIMFGRDISLKDYNNDHEKVLDIKHNVLKLTKYLESDQLENDILKYIAPHFKLDMTMDD